MQPDNQQPYQLPPNPTTPPVVSGQPGQPLLPQPQQSQPGQPVSPIQPGITQPTPNPQNPPAPKDKKSAISTQNTLLFSEMRENMIIMSDGSFRAVIECQSINFDLMSTREREAI